VDDFENAHQISAGGGVEVLWCWKTSELFYRNGTRWFAVPISTEGELKWGSPRLVWETDFVDTLGRSYDVSPDGKRLLVPKRRKLDITDRVHMISNWPVLLAKGSSSR
jgi:hypothetical protein